MADPSADAEIAQLLARYCQLCDDGELDALLDCFTVDGSFVFGRRTMNGTDELRVWFETQQGPDQRGRHVTANVVATIDGDHAAVVSDFVFLSRSGATFAPLLAGRYHDELRRKDGRWRFARRHADVR